MTWVYTLHPKVGYIDILHFFVFRMQIVALMLAVKTEPFQRILFFICECNNNIANFSSLLFANDNKIAIINLSINHRVSGCTQSIEITFAKKRKRTKAGILQPVLLVHQVCRKE